MKTPLPFPESKTPPVHTMILDGSKITLRFLGTNEKNGLNEALQILLNNNTAKTVQISE